MRNLSKTQRTRKQNGVALFVVMMFVIILSGMAAFSVRNATLGEKLARNQLDRSIAVQAAEAALRDAERDLFLRVKPAAALCDRIARLERPASTTTFIPKGNWSSTCTAGQCMFDSSAYTLGAAPWRPSDPTSNVPSVNIWNNDSTTKSGAQCNFTGGVPLGKFTGAAPFLGVAKQPEYLMEYFQVGRSNIVRVTARGFGADPNTEVVLQSEVRVFVEIG